MVPTQRQTLGYLRTLFSERGIAPKDKLGQNFLIDLNLIDLAVRAAEITPDDLVLEVGSGTGSMTMKLVERAGALLTVEIDPPFAALTEDVLNTHFAISEGLSKPTGARRAHVRLLSGDALDGKNTFNPALLRDLRELMALAGTKHVKLVSNLPYSVAVPVLSNLLLTDLPVERMVGMVQWELAERMMAVPGTKDYGSLAVLMQSLATVELVRKVPPKVFYPPPKVDSAIVRIKPDPAKRAKVGDVRRFRFFLRDLYTHRRKNLRGALHAMPGQSLGKPEIDARLAAIGMDGSARAEGLGLEDHLRLSNEFGTSSGDDA